MTKQRLQQKQKFNLTPQQIQFLSLLQIPLSSLNSRIQEELEENLYTKGHELQLDDKKNKTQKPNFYVHGNLRVLRCNFLLESNDLFGNNSLGISVPKKFALDVDGPDDFEIAEMYLSSGFILLK